MRSCVSNLVLIAPVLGAVSLFLSSGQCAQAAAQTQAPVAASLDAAKPTVSTGTDIADTASTKPDGKPGKAHKKPEDLLFNMRIRGGTYSVDGMVAKVRLDYDLEDARFLYFYLPGVGTAVVSRFKSPGSELVADAFTDKVIEFAAGGHNFALDSDSIAPGKESHDLFVRFDTDRIATNLGGYPQVGFGAIPQAPYAWPGALPEERSTADAHTLAPPVPAFMLPRRLSYAGTTAQ